MDKKGFTLVEIIVSITVLGIVFVFIYQNFLFQQKGLRNQREWSEVNMMARKASNYIVDEIRHIGFSRRALSPIDKFGIINGNASSIEYTYDELDEKGTPGVLDPFNKHSLELRNDTLFIDGDWALVHVASLEFIYIDGFGQVITLPVQEVSEAGDWLGNNPVNRIQFVLKVFSPYRGDTVEYSSTVGIRNTRP